MRSSGGLGDDFVDHSQLDHVFSSDLQGLGGEIALAGVAPHDGGAPFGSNYGIDAVLEHEHAVGNSNRQGAARAALSGNGGDDGHLEASHLAQISSDGLRLAALF